MKAAFIMPSMLPTALTFGIFTFCLFGLPCNAAQPDFWIQSSAQYVQVGDTAPSPDADYPYHIHGRCTLNDGQIFTAQLKSPLDIFKSFAIEDSNSALFQFEYVNLNALNLEFPKGNYTLTAQTSLGNVTNTTKYNSPKFSAAPRIKAGSNTLWFNNYLCVADNNKSCTISWTPANKWIENVTFKLKYDDAITFFEKDLKKGATSIDIPLSTLNSITQEKIIAQVWFNSSLNGDVSTEFYIYKPINTSPFYFIVTHSFNQSDNSTITELSGNSATLYYDYGPYNVSVSAGRNGIVIGPNGKKIPLTATSAERAAFNSGPILNISALDKAFPEGTYTIGQQSATLTGGTYPNSGSPIKITSVNGATPEWSNGKLILDYNTENVISWTPFAIDPDTFATTGEIFFEQRAGDVPTWTTKTSGAISVDKAPFNSYTFPANTLGSNKESLLRITYFLTSSVDSESNSACAYSTATYVWIAPK